MKIRPFTMKISVAILCAFFWHCSEEPLSSELNHSTLHLDTLLINDVEFINYLIYPTLGSNEKLYLGTKDSIDIPITFIEMETPSYINYWGYLEDTNYTIDSIRLLLFSNDSSLEQESTPHLYFSPDSHFNENSSNYLDFDGLVLSDWIDVGKPRIKENILDTSNTFLYSQLIWSLDTLKDALYDTSDSNLVRTFALQFPDENSSFIELFSEEAASNVTDPQVLIYYHFDVSSSDTTIYDTNFVTIFSSSDLSIIKPKYSHADTSKIGLSSGLGLRAKMNISFSANDLLLLDGALIKSANLEIPIDTTISDSGYKIIIDPIQNDSSEYFPSNIFLNDPYLSYGSPYRVSNNTNGQNYVVSLKDYFQNIVLGNVNNIGYKIVGDDKNSPFQSVWFDLNDSTKKPQIKIVYVSF